MPDQYDIDYAQQVTELLPPDKRYAHNTAFLVDCMKSTLQYLRDALLGDYRNGSTVGAWVDPATSMAPYARGIKVNYKKGIYVSLIDNNSDNPTVTTSWYFQQTFFIGLTERLAYNGNNLVLTYALNRWFGTTFRQPGGGLSDIYITTNPIPAKTFILGYLSTECSTIGWTGSSEAITYDSTFGPAYNANIYVPNTLIASLGSAAMALISSFVNKYIYAGITYQIIGY